MILLILFIQMLIQVSKIPNSNDDKNNNNLQQNTVKEKDEIIKEPLTHES